jgi:hypothetical protein
MGRRRGVNTKEMLSSGSDFNFNFFKTDNNRASDEEDDEQEADS